MVRVVGAQIISNPADLENRGRDRTCWEPQGCPLLTRRGASSCVSIRKGQCLRSLLRGLHVHSVDGVGVVVDDGFASEFVCRCQVITAGFPDIGQDGVFLDLLNA